MHLRYASQDHQMSCKLAKYAERLKEGRKHILNSNIKLGYGSDIVFQHNNYDCGNEYSCWLRSGTDPFRALKAATSINAEIIGIKDVGRIEEGAYADIAAWSKDILTDHRALMDCAFVTNLPWTGNKESMGRRSGGRSFEYCIILETYRR